MTQLLFRPVRVEPGHFLAPDHDQRHAGSPQAFEFGGTFGGSFHIDVAERDVFLCEILLGCLTAGHQLVE